MDDHGRQRGQAIVILKQSTVTPLVLTWNEAPNISRCLQRLAWAERVLVLDSGSTDETAPLVRQFPNAELHERVFDDHTTQWNHGLDLARTPWVLALDADYVLPEGFADEIRSLEPGGDHDAYFARFRYCIGGRPLRGALYPPRAVLFRKDRCHYVPDGHTQKLHIPGSAGMLRSMIDHDDRKPLSRWFVSQDHYAKLEAVKLWNTSASDLRLQDRLRLTMVAAPVATFFYCLFVKGLIFDGWRGWFYTWQRVMAEVMLALRLLERKCRMTNAE